MGTLELLNAFISPAIVLCGLLPLFPWLDPIPRALICAGFLAGMWQQRRGPWPVSNRVYTAAAVPLFLYYALQFSPSNPLRPTSGMLAVMLAVRLAGPKTPRHYLQLMALSLFCLAASSLYDLSPRFLVYLCLLLLLAAIHLVLLTFHEQLPGLHLPRPVLVRVVATGLLLPLASVPLLLFFFPLLPRTRLPLWNIQPPAAARTSGFSEQVETGRSPVITPVRSLAFRAEMPKQPDQQLYWRTTVFNRMNGQRWLRENPPAESGVAEGRQVSQMVYPEPGAGRALPALDLPVMLTLPRSRQAADGVLEYQGNSGKRISYQVISVPGGGKARVVSIRNETYLSLPAGLSPRIRQLADSIRARGKTDRERLSLLESHFRNGGYRYTMAGLPTGDHALEQFLFDTRQGHCEFFASAFALLLRGTGVPARVVGGFLGGDYNELGGYYLVSEDMAHAWVEAYITGDGWQRIDPSSLAVNAGSIGTIRSPGIRWRLRLAADSLDHAWNRAVITYDFERQMQAAAAAGARLQRADITALRHGVVAILAVPVPVIMMLLLIRNRRRLFPSREERLLRAFYLLVERKFGLRVERGRVGLFDVAELSGSPAVREFVDIYAGAVYRDRKLAAEEFRHLRRILSRLS